MYFKALFLLFGISYSLKAFSSNEGDTLPPVKRWFESDYVKYHCKGKIEYVLPNKTRIDCLTDTHAIEYDWGKKWAEAIGQSLYYSAMTNKKAGIVLIVNERTKDRYLKRVMKAVNDKNLDIDIWTIRK